MNIEQKNTLFVVSLVLAVLLSVAAMAYWLVTSEVSDQIARDLKRSHAVFVETQEQSFHSLEAQVRRLGSSPSLVAATLTGDLPTINGMLRSLSRRGAPDLLALYQAHQSRIAAQSRTFDLTSPQVLSSAPFDALVGVAERTGHPAFGHASVFGTFLRLVAVPVRGPFGRQLGVLVAGQQLSGDAVTRLRELVGADVILYSANGVLGSTMPAPDRSLDSVARASAGERVAEFSAAGHAYYGRVYPILDQRGGSAVASLLLALPAANQWVVYHQLWRIAAYFSVLILLVSALIGISISRRWLTVPLKRLAQVAAAIGRGDLSARMTETRRDEVGDLARTFNQMLIRLKLSQSEEAVSRQRFHDFAASTSDWLWETNADGQLSFVSQNVVSTLSVNAEDLVGRTFNEVFPQDNMREIMVLLQPATGSIAPLKDVELWITTREGIRLCLRLNAMPYFETGRFCGFRGTARDITKVKNDEERLIHMANRDHLTGLSNRRRFMEDLAREVAIAERQQQTGALLLIDLDHFKLVNDTAGHAAGDEVIVQIGGMLRRLARNVDLVARLSGDEFAIALLNTTWDQAEKRAAQILQHVSQLRPMYGGKILNTSASIGIVVYPEHGTSPVDLLSKADTAMYAAKKAGRNRAHLYSDDDMAQQLMGSQLTWKERIHEALEQDLFELAFQPIVSTRGVPTARYEVLVRLRGQDGSLHTPGSFIPTAEQFGLIRQVDSVIVRKAIRTLAAQPPGKPAVAFSINLSGLSVGDPEIMNEIERELSAARVDRHRVVFEITESAACEDINRAMEFVGRIRAMGCRVALDDFGVGFSSFSYLKHLKVDIIKIDGSFIRDINNSKEDQLFVKALVDVARGMGMQTVAEFVENADALSMVRALGVDYAQGYHVGKPQPLPIVAVDSVYSMPVSKV